MLAIATFGGAVETADIEAPPSYYILAGVHYLAGLIPIGLTRGLLAGPIGKALALFLAGIVVSTFYNVFAALEEVLSKAIWTLEQRYHGGKIG